MPVPQRKRERFACVLHHDASAHSALGFVAPTNRTPLQQNPVHPSDSVAHLEVFELHAPCSEQTPLQEHSGLQSDIQTITAAERLQHHLTLIFALF
jgi:hypothetical protein